MGGILFFLLIWGAWKVPSVVFLPSLSCRSPQAKGAQWQAASLAAFFAFCSVSLNFLLEYFRI